MNFFANLSLRLLTIHLSPFYFKMKVKRNPVRNCLSGRGLFFTLVDVL